MKDEIKRVRPKQPAGRPRKDGSPPRARAKALPIGVRVRIKEMLLAGATRAQIKLKFRRYAPSDAQINAVKYDRVKLQSEPRIDAYQSPRGKKRPTTGRDATELLKDGLIAALESQESRSRINPGEYMSLLERAARVDRHVKSCELESHLKRADSRIIEAIIRRFLPDATTEQIVAIYREEVAKLRAELNHE